MPATVRKKQTAERCEFSDRPLVLYAFVPLPRDHDVPDQSAIRSNWQVCGGGAGKRTTQKKRATTHFPRRTAQSVPALRTKRRQGSRVLLQKAAASSWQTHDRKPPDRNRMQGERFFLDQSSRARPASPG